MAQFYMTNMTTAEQRVQYVAGKSSHWAHRSCSGAQARSSPAFTLFQSFFSNLHKTLGKSENKSLVVYYHGAFLNL